MIFSKCVINTVTMSTVTIKTYDIDVHSTSTLVATVRITNETSNTSFDVINKHKEKLKIVEDILSAKFVEGSELDDLTTVINNHRQAIATITKTSTLKFIAKATMYPSQTDKEVVFFLLPGEKTKTIFIDLSFYNRPVGKFNTSLSIYSEFGMRLAKIDRTG